MEEFRRELESILGLESVKTEEMMKGHTTFRIGGPADYYVTPESAGQLAKVIRLCGERNMPYHVVGNGSNLLVSDRGYRGVIIAMTERMGTCTIERAPGQQGAGGRAGDEETPESGGARFLVTAGAGIRLFHLAKKIEEASLTGFE